MKLINLEFLPYLDTLKVQNEALARLEQNGEESLIIVEHPKTITLGLRSSSEDLKTPELRLLASGVEVIKAKRGGGATCHFPGQLVAYPIMKVIGRAGGLKRFVCDLEEVIIQTLLHYQIIGARKHKSPGIWVEAGQFKIASLGLGLRKGLSFHGIALNVEPNIDLFGSIVPCGDKDLQVTSIHHELIALQNLSLAMPSLQEVQKVFVQNFETIFNIKFSASDWDNF